MWPSPLPRIASPESTMLGRILLPLDGSDRAEATLPAVVPLARAFGATVDLLHVVPDRASLVRSGPEDSLRWRISRKRAEDYLAVRAGWLRGAGLTVETHVSEGGPAEVIVDLLLDGHHDLVALTARGMGDRDLLHMGCTSGAIVVHSPTSVLLVPGVRGRGNAESVDRASFRKIGVPIDGTPRSEWALGVASLLAKREDASLLLLHALCRPETFGSAGGVSEGERASRLLVDANRASAHSYMARAVEQQGGAGVEVKSLILEPDGDIPSRVLSCAETEGIDLVILSAHGEQAGSGWMLAPMPLRFLLAARFPTLVLQDLPARREAVFVDAPHAGP
jgi:nucleotide-binding universal stress UspA family protein